jgi:hypothetical protein
MIAIAAVTHAIDGFAGDVEPYGVPKDLRDRWAKNRTASRGPIIETLKHAFHVGGHVEAWRRTLDDLFELLRNPALHHRPEFRGTVPHPTLPTNVGPEYVDYAIENVEQAVTFMLELFETCILGPKAEKLEVVEWAKTCAHSSITSSPNVGAEPRAVCAPERLLTGGCLIQVHPRATTAIAAATRRRRLFLDTHGGLWRKSRHAPAGGRVRSPGERGGRRAAARGA